MFSFFHHQQLRRYLLAFGSFFDSIDVRRYDTTGKVVQRIQVPIEYGPKERWLVNITENPDFSRGIGIALPRLSYEMTGIAYDGNRKLNTMNQLRFPNTEQARMARTYVGVPYLLNIQLSALVKFQTDGFQIVEQILPYFTPDLTFVVQNVPELGIADQIPMTLTNVSSADNYEGDFEKRRVIVWTLDFQLKVYFYGPNKSQGRIEEVIVDVYNAPIASLNEPPEYFATENDSFIVDEQSEGLLATEETANVYLTTGRVARVTATADPRNQQSEPPNVTANVTLTDYSGDVKRTRQLTDDET